MKKTFLGTGIFWYWNATPTPAGIRRQLAAIAESGISCVYVHPMPDNYCKKHYFVGMKCAYLGKKYFELYRTVLNECKKLGLTLMLYDEGGWPSGSVLNTLIKKFPECCGTFLRRDDHGRIYSVSADFPDQLAPQSTEHFIEMTHELYKREFGSEFGKTIKGIFTDEPFFRCACDDDEVYFSPAMRELAEEMFQCSFEDDLLPFLWKGRENLDGAFEARRKYMAISSRLFADNYCSVLSRWCEQNHLEFEGHFDHEDFFFRVGDCGDLLDFSAPFHVPGVDAIWRQIFPNEGNGYYAKFASSAAIRMHRHQALCECFNVYGYGLTPPQMDHIANSLFTRGINRIILMPYLYSDHGKHKICCSTDFSPRIPQWKPLKKLIKKWNFISNFDTGALEAPVWVLARCEYPLPDNRWQPSEKNLQAEARLLEILNHLDDETIFWRFTNLTELEEMKNVPNALICCGNLDDWEKAILEKLYPHGVKIFNNWNDSLKEFSTVNVTVDSDKCRVTPCVRENGEALMIFNPESEEQKFIFHSKDRYESLSDDPDLELSVVEYADEKVSVLLAPGELRVIQKSSLESEPVKFKKLPVQLNWHVTKLKKMEMHAEKSTNFREFQVDRNLLKNGIWEDENFSGVLIMESEFDAAEKVDGFLCFENLFHAGELFVNGKSCGMLASKPWKFKLKLRQGNNKLTMHIYSAAGNEWRRCLREELIPRKWTNNYLQRLSNFSSEDSVTGISLNAWLLLKHKS